MKPHNLFANGVNFVAWTLALFLLTGVGTPLRASDELRRLTDSLHQTIDQKASFAAQKEERIARIRHLLGADLTFAQEYKINSRLCDEYRKFEVDSAIHYASKNLWIARQLGDDYRRCESSLQLSMLYSMCSRYRDAETILKTLSPKELPPDLLVEYYRAYSSFWEYYAISLSDNNYEPQRVAYEDSMLCRMDRQSFRYKLSRSYYYTNSAPQKAQELLQDLLETEEVGTPNYAMITHSYAMLCRNLGQREEAKKFLMRSAIADIRNATRETASLQQLALMEYEDGNLADAFEFTQSVIDDVVSSGIHFRAMENYRFYSIINSAYQEAQQRSRANLKISLVAISTTSVLLVLLVVFVYIQMKKNVRIKRALAQSNEELRQLNERLNLANSQLNAANSRLNETNRQLNETNNVKEHYIAEFFDICFSYIHKMEKFQNMLYKTAINKYYDELIKKLKSPALIDEELHTLYDRFDKVFIDLYPTFVADFNALLREDERIMPRPDALLNKELRIYALLRLGINDSSKIANFLRCSTSTVYNYRTKIRNKAIGDRDLFEDEVMKISSSALQTIYIFGGSKSD
ncbi:MAG: DUF6377 domain-containing protein [Mediterranea sp.]|jgi:DNA-binding CsgD family transcriptional regulator|nr:DUF6377 domain-containing protein [Mediterranea sp.]